MSRERLGYLAPAQRSKLLKLLGESPEIGVVRFGKYTHQVIRTVTKIKDPSQVATIGKREIWYENLGNNGLAEYHKSVYLAYCHVANGNNPIS